MYAPRHFSAAALPCRRRHLAVVFPQSRHPERSEGPLLLLRLAFLVTARRRRCDAKRRRECTRTCPKGFPASFGLPPVSQGRACNRATVLLVSRDHEN